MDPIDGYRSKKADDAGGVKAGGSDLSGRGGRPRWTLLLVAGFVVLVVGGFALSRDYGVPSVSAPSDLEEVAVPSPSSTTVSTVTTLRASEPSEPEPLDWTNDLIDVAITAEGVLYVAAPGGVAWRGAEGDWVLVDLEGLPAGMGVDGFVPGRTVSQIAAGPDGSLWVAGYATSHADDEEFGGEVDGWTGGRFLEWVARYHCPACDEWTVWTSDETPALGGGIGGLVVSSEGIVYASAGEDTLVVFDGQTWESFVAPIPTDSGNGVAYPWSGSLAVGTDGVVWAGTNYSGRGVVAFDGTGFTRYTTEDGLPPGYIHEVAAGGDGTIWATSDGAGVASFDGTTWTTHTTFDGLLSHDAQIAAGADGTVWAVHGEIPPFGYSRFDGTGWTTWGFDGPVIGFGAEVAPDGTVWGISMGALVSFDGTTRTVHPSPFLHPSALGTITVSIDGWAGVDGYRLLAVVWDEDYDVVGGAFWTIVDSDPYSTTDVVHPPFDGEDPPGVGYETWGDGDYLWDKTAWLEPGTYQATFWANPGELAPYGNLIPALPIERECQVTVEVTAGYNTEVVISDVPLRRDGDECQRTTADTSVRFFTFTPVQWGIHPEEGGPNVYSVHMIADVRPLTLDETEDVSGRLVWDETTVDLCGISIRQEGDGFLHIGDIFGTDEGCGINPTAMQDAFDEFGLPETACLTVTVDGLDHDYCAPLGDVDAVSVGSGRGAIRVTLEGLEGFEGLDVDAWVVAVDPRDGWQRLGGIHFGLINQEPFSASDLIHPPGENYISVDRSKVAMFEPGVYRLIIEAYVPLGDMHYGCEMPIQIVDGQPSVVTFTSLPTYTESGIHWTPLDELEYPDCPD